MSIPQADGFLEGIRVDEPLGLRDRALFELIYSSGLRRGEAAGLVAGDLKRFSGQLMIRCSKNARDRLVPVTEMAMHYLRLYLPSKARQKGRSFSPVPGGLLALMQSMRGFITG